MPRISRRARRRGVALVALCCVCLAALGGVALLDWRTNLRATSGMVAARWQPADTERPVLRGAAAPGNAFEHYERALACLPADGARLAEALAAVERGAQCGRASAAELAGFGGQLWFGGPDVVAYGALVEALLNFLAGRHDMDRRGAARGSLACAVMARDLAAQERAMDKVVGSTLLEWVLSRLVTDGRLATWPRGELQQLIADLVALELFLPDFARGFATEAAWVTVAVQEPGTLATLGMSTARVNTIHELGLEIWGPRGLPWIQAHLARLGAAARGPWNDALEEIGAMQRELSAWENPLRALCLRPTVELLAPPRTAIAALRMVRVLAHELIHEGASFAAENPFGGVITLRREAGALVAHAERKGLEPYQLRAALR